MNEEKNKVLPHTLYLVATPIGNLSDLSPRGVKVLSECDFIAAEDTRNTRKLLTYFGISRETVSYHEHNRFEAGEAICRRLEAGESCALVTDAGMPAISDPGEDLVDLCARRGITVSVIPGCCAAVSALALSGLPTGRFVFEGFLSSLGKDRQKRLKELKDEKRTLIFYEAPHRLVKTLTDMKAVFGPSRRIALVRELTKRNEEALRTTLGEALLYYQTAEPRGEYVLVVEGGAETEPADHADYTDLSPTQHVAAHEAAGLSHKDAIKAAATDRGLSKSEFYALLVKEKEQDK